MDPLAELDPALRDLIEALPPLDITEESLGGIRTVLASLLPELGTTPGVRRSDHVVDDERGVVVRIHHPDGWAGPLPCIYAIHGGGYVMGTRDTEDHRFERWGPLLGCIGAAVEYRVAPEHPYPAALDDCRLGLAWVREHAEALGIDPAAIGVAGNSAGGGLSAALAIAERDAGTPVAFQLLESPMLDDRQVTASSQRAGLPVWTREANTFGWRSYLGALHGTDAIPATAAPARLQDPAGLPPTLLNVGGVDGFCDEDVAYAAALLAAGVPTDLHVYAGAPHGFQSFGGLGASRRANADAEAWLRLRFTELGHPRSDD